MFSRNIVRKYFFIILAAVMLIFMFLYFYKSDGMRIFTHGKYFHADFNNIFTTKRGTPITISGIEVGHVLSVEILSNNNIRLKFFIDKKYLDKILDDSVLVLNRNVALQTPSVKLYPGDNIKNILNENSVVLSSDSSYGAALKNRYEQRQNINADLEDMGRYFVVLLSSIDKETLNKYMKVFRQYLSYVNTSIGDDSFNALADIDSNLVEIFSNLEDMNIEIDEIIKFINILLGNKSNIDLLIKHATLQSANASLTVRQAQDMVPKIYDLIHYMNMNIDNMVLFLEIYDKFQ